MKSTGAKSLRNYAKSMHNALTHLPYIEINLVVDALLEAMLQSKQVFVLGNGGSAATATHFAGDIGKTTALDFGCGVVASNAPRLRIRSLTENSTWLTAIGNDLDYSDIFLEQLKNFLEPDDVVIGLSGSGRSSNVVRALEYAQIVGSTSICLTSERASAEDVCAVSNIQLRAPVTMMEQIEDMHSIYCHMIVLALCERLALHNEQISDAESSRKGEVYDYANA